MHKGTLALCRIRKKNFLPKMGFLQNLWQDFTCVEQEKKTSSQKWGSYKIYGKCNIFLMAVYLFSNIVNDSATLHRLIISNLSEDSYYLTKISPNLFDCR